MKKAEKIKERFDAMKSGSEYVFKYSAKFHVSDFVLDSAAEPDVIIGGQLQKLYDHVLSQMKADITFLREVSDD